MKNTFLALLAALSFGVASCDTYSYPTPLPTKTDESKEPEIYGDVGGEPRQHKNVYPANPDAAANAAAIRVKLFAPEGKPVSIDTAKALQQTAE